MEIEKTEIKKSKWTPEQERAIKIRNCNVLVAAAAGAGKTSVLVERIIQMLTETDTDKRINIDELLVVTFTNAAAGEMKERIIEGISKKLDSEELNGDDDVRKFLQHQITLLNKANIKTMHSFCLDVVKNNFAKIDLNPSFRIADETEINLLKSDILEELFEEKYDEEDEKFTRFLEAYGSYKDDNSIKKLILNLHNFLMSCVQPEKWLQEKTEKFYVEDEEKFEDSVWVKIIKEELKANVYDCCEKYREILNIINEADFLEKYREIMENEACMVNNLKEVLDSGIDEIYEKLQSINFERMPSPRFQGEEKIIKENMTALRAYAKEKIETLKETTFYLPKKDLIAQINGCYPYLEALKDIVLLFAEKFQAAKREKNLVDFNDLEHYCLEILSEKNEEDELIPSKTAKEFKAKFREVLFDEYQDANNIQETIIGLVSRREDEDKNVFMVGDVKQSIYRFRQSNPKLFLQKYNTYTDTDNLEENGNIENPGKENSGYLIKLYKNFRSDKEILSSVNFIFKKLMSREVGEIEYTEKEYLNYRDENDTSQLKEPVEVDIIDKKAPEENTEENTEETDDNTEDMDAVKLEAKFVAKRIKELINPESGERFKVFDKNLNDNKGGKRDIEYKDIVILLRSGQNWSSAFLKELSEEGIPAYAETKTGYFDSIEIRIMISLLTIIDNPMQDIPFAAVLNSPIGGFNTEDLTDLRIYDKKECLYKNLKSLSCDENFKDKKLKEKSFKFITKLDVWRKKSLFMPVDEFIWYLYSDTSYYGFAGAMPNGVLRQANLKIFFQRARQFEETSFKGLFNFLRFIEKLIKSSNSDLGEAKIVGENENVVRIMTMHKSKGLEFPVVFLSGCGKNFNMMNLKEKIIYDDELGFGPKYIDFENRTISETLPRMAIKNIMKKAAYSEELRILYVALTRAKEKLIITGSVSGIKKETESWLKAAANPKNTISPSDILDKKSFISWIGMALCQHKDGIREIKKITEEKNANLIEIIENNLEKENKIKAEQTSLLKNDSEKNEIYINENKEELNEAALEAENNIQKETVTIKIKEPDSIWTLNFFNNKNEETEEENNENISEEEILKIQSENKKETEEEENKKIDESINEIIAGIKDKKVFEKINRKLSYKYPWIESSAIKSTISVTELKKRALEESEDIINDTESLIKEINADEEGSKEKIINEFMPDFLKEKKGHTPAQAGTIIHFVMSRLDFSKVSSVSEISNQIQEMINNHYLKEDERKVIKAEKIFKFFKSSVGKMLIETYKKNPEKIYREFPFYKKISAKEVYKDMSEIYKNEYIRLKGIIDCFFEYDGRIILLDYKTDYVGSRNKEELIKKYEKQLYYYDMAVEALTGKKSYKKYLYSFYLDTDIELD